MINLLSKYQTSTTIQEEQTKHDIRNEEERQTYLHFRESR
jgi:hypothetical protein